MVPSRWGPSCHMIMPILPRTSGLLGRKDASIPAGVQSTSVISLHSRWNLHWFVRNLRIEPAELGADLSILLPGRDHLKLCQLWTTLPMLNALDPATQVVYMEKKQNFQVLHQRPLEFAPSGTLCQTYGSEGTSLIRSTWIKLRIWKGKTKSERVES